MRPNNWPNLLSDYIESSEAKSFEWGSHDCVHFAAGWLRVLGYQDPLAPFASWSTALSAYREIKRHGGFGLAVASRMAALGCHVTPPSRAQRGDIALCQVDYRRQALGIVCGQHVAAPGVNRGVILVPLLPAAICTWHA